MMGESKTALQIAMLSIHSSPVGDLGTMNTGGMSVYIRELARELGQRGHRIDIFTRCPGKRVQPVVNLNRNVRLVHLRIGAKRRASKQALYHQLPHFRKTLEAFVCRQKAAYDLIHSHYWLSGRLGQWLRERWRLPHMMMFHTLGAAKNANASDQPEPNRRIKAERRLVHSCDRILVATGRERDNLLKHYAGASERIGVIPCGVDLQLFRPADKRIARRQLGLDPDEDIVLYVGRFEPLKGIDRLLAAAAKLHHRPGLRLIIVGGDGPQASATRALQRMARALGLAPRVTFAGRASHSDLPLFYNAADILVIPSLYESFGLVALEALACGLPVVSTRVGAMESIITNYHNGLLVAKANPELLAEGIESLLNRSLSLGHSSAQIRRSVLKFEWPRVASAMIEEYRALLASSITGPGQEVVHLRHADVN